MMKVRPAFAKALAAAASAATAFALIDANPSLWIFDRFAVNESRLNNHFKDKTIWITGASSGIGAALAQQLSKTPARLILSGRDEKKLQKVVSLCGNAEAITFDVDCDQDEMDRVVDSVGDIDCVVLNAGVGQLLPAEKTPREKTEQLMRVNTLSPIHLAQTLMRRKHPKAPTHFVVTSSIAATLPVPLSASYAASKHAVHGYFKSLACENPDIRVDLPCPGPVKTSFLDKASGETTNDDTSSSDNRERKMSAQRCARLILSSMLLPFGGETWIAQQPTLTFLYLNQIAPGFAYMLLRLLGPTRVAIWEAGLNLYDASSIRKLRNHQKKLKETRKE